MNGAILFPSASRGRAKSLILGRTGRDGRTGRRGGTGELFAVGDGGAVFLGELAQRDLCAPADQRGILLQLDVRVLLGGRLELEIHQRPDAGAVPPPQHGHGDAFVDLFLQPERVGFKDRVGELHLVAGPDAVAGAGLDRQFTAGPQADQHQQDLELEQQGKCCKLILVQLLLNGQLLLVVVV